MRTGYGETIEMLEGLVDSGVLLSWGDDRNSINWKEEARTRRLDLPLLFPRANRDASVEDYVRALPEVPPRYVVVLMRAGSASLGYWIDGDLEAHKVIRKYMVRMSQGKSQIAYLNQKGKSRAGSRIRLRETVEFFEEINQKLADWFDELGPPETLFHSCPVRLWSFWFSSRVSMPFDEKDERLVHIPHHVHQPDHEELLRVARLLGSGYVAE